MGSPSFLVAFVTFISCLPYSHGATNYSSFPAEEYVQAALSGNSSSYTGFGFEIYFNATLQNQTQTISTNYDKYEAQAKKKLPKSSYDYAAGSAGLELTAKANRDAFDQWRIVPHVMRKNVARNLTTTIFNKTIPAPIFMAPVGVQTIFHPDGERATAAAFGQLGLPFTLSTASSTGFSDVAKANGPNGTRWYQLYWPPNDDLARSFLDTAKKNGYTGLMVTVDTWEFGWRTRELDDGFFPFINGVGVQIGLEDPVAHQQLGFNPLARNATSEQKRLASLYQAISTSSGISPTWDDLPKLRKWWGDGPILLKGVQRVEDAEKAVLDYGMDGIIVSNHGGRQVDGALGTLDALDQITQSSKLRGKAVIGFDGGIRTGADIFKALALGANFVQIGRPAVWGLSLGGTDGVLFVMKNLLGDFEATLGLAGYQSIHEVNRSALVRKSRWD